MVHQEVWRMAIATAVGIFLALRMLRFDVIVFVHSLAVPSAFDATVHCVPGHRNRSILGTDGNRNRHDPSVALRSSANPSDANQPQPQDVEYRSIGEVVGGLHGGKYQFGGDGSGIQGWGSSGSDAFSGAGGAPGTGPEYVASIPDDQAQQQLPNWAQTMAPKVDDVGTAAILEIPSNANPMDGLIHGASFRVQNQERTWEPFYAKVGIFNDDSGHPAFVELLPSDLLLSLAPSSGVLAPRGGASNACDASRPYSDTVTLRIVSLDVGASDAALSQLRPTAPLWLVVGTEEERWSCCLEFLPRTTR